MHNFACGNFPSIDRVQIVIFWYLGKCAQVLSACSTCDKKRYKYEQNNSEKVVLEQFCTVAEATASTAGLYKLQSTNTCNNLNISIQINFHAS